MKRYGDQVAVDELDLDIPRGEVFSASVGLDTAVDGESSEAVIARASRQMYDARLERHVRLTE